MHIKEGLVVMLVGNKADLVDSRAVQQEEARAFCEREGLYFVETSALEGSNVEKAFMQLLAEIWKEVGKRAGEVGTLTRHTTFRRGASIRLKPKQVIRKGFLEEDEVQAEKCSC